VSHSLHQRTIARHRSICAATVARSWRSKKDIAMAQRIKRASP